MGTDDEKSEEELLDVDVNNSVSSEHPEAGSNGGDDPEGEDPEESRSVPASDPESGA